MSTEPGEPMSDKDCYSRGGRDFIVHDGIIFEVTVTDSSESEEL